MSISENSAAPAAGNEQTESGTVALLTIGNSFADNVLNQLPQIVKAAGNELIYAKANLGSCSLGRHWRHMQAYEKDHNDPNGKPYADASLKDMLTRHCWDVVTIQQVSTLSHALDTYKPYAADICHYIGQYAPQAKIYIHQAWAYRKDDPRFTKETVARVPHTQKEMHRQIRSANHTIAKELGIDILPSGDAMYLAETDPEWQYRPDHKFDFKQAEYPELPDQTHSLHQGWFWQKQQDGTWKLVMDGHHANSAGEYLCAGVWFEILYGESFVDCSYVPDGVDNDFARFLRRTAHKTVESVGM